MQLRAGQIRPLVFDLACENEVSQVLRISISYKVKGESNVRKHTFEHKMKFKSYREVHKFTFLHAGIVSYAMLRPPQDWSLHSTLTKAVSLPILLNLHGAGLEADDPQLTRSLDSVSELPEWTLFPTGGSPWSGDDWHVWGWADVEAAIRALPIWINNTNWRGPSANTNLWLVAGHSNGGQGVWHALTHRPDNIIGAVAASGYLSIQKYVPYSLWHEADPGRTAVVQASLAEHRHELLIDNAKGIPIMQQHGAADDNVPAYHSRRMSQLLNQSGWSSQYLELAGEGHWFEGIMETEPLQRFYKSVLSNYSTEVNDERTFTLTSANPGVSGSKHGFKLDSLLDPGRLGKLEVGLQAGQLRLSTFNVDSLRIPNEYIKNASLLIVDGQTIDLPDADSLIHLRQSMSDGKWQLDIGEGSKRNGKQLGRLDAIFSSNDTFRIKCSSNAEIKPAVQVSRNLFQYSGADAEISDENESSDSCGHTISIIKSEDIQVGHLKDHPIEVVNGIISVRDDNGFIRKYSAASNSAIFLRPLPMERLELVVWGSDDASLARAARMMPMLPGVGQPEFIILSRECAWRGIEGVLAMGFFDSQWNVTRSSFFS